MRRSPFVEGGFSPREFAGGRGAIALPPADAVPTSQIARATGLTTRSVLRGLRGQHVAEVGRGGEHLFPAQVAEKFIIEKTKPVGLCPWCGELCSSNRAGTCGSYSCTGKQYRSRLPKREPYVVADDGTRVTGRFVTINDVMEMTSLSRTGVLKRFAPAYVGRGVGYNVGLRIFMYDAGKVEQIIRELEARTCEVCGAGIPHARYGQRMCGSSRCADKARWARNRKRGQ